MTTFFTDYDAIELTKRLNSIIQIKNEDNLTTHLRQTMLFKDEGLVSGTIGNDCFKVWTHEQGRSGVTGIFYPIIEGRLKPLSRGLKIEFKSKMNIVGRIIFLLLAFGIGYGIVTGIIIQDNNELRFLLPRFLIGALLLGLFMSLPIYIHIRTTRITKKYLIDNLGLNTTNVLMNIGTKDILPGWTLKVDEFSPGAYQITLTDQDGRKAEIVDNYNESTLDKCARSAFNIERQTKRNWNKFLYDFANLRLKSINIQENKYHDQSFGSWTIQTNEKRLLLDGKDGWLYYEEKQDGDWVDKEIIKEFEGVTFEQFKGLVKKIV